MARSDFPELNAVVAVATHRSFRAAALEMDMSPSALSHAIASLEKRMGVRLFNRTTRSVALTEAGEQFLARIGPALREISEAMDAVNAHRETPSGTLRINTSEGASQRIFEPLVMPFLTRYPDMKFDLMTEGRFVDIVAEGFDAGIRLVEAVPQDMIAIPVGHDHRFCVVGSPDYFSGRTQPQVPADLFSHQCLRRRLPSGRLYRWEFERHGEQVVLDVNGPLTLDSDILMRRAALRGMGLAYLSEWAIAGDLAAGRLIEVLIDWTPPTPGISLYYPRHRHMTAGLRAFVDLLRQVNAAQWPPATPFNSSSI